MSFTNPKGLSASRWASSVTSWPRPPPTTFNNSRQPDVALPRRAHLSPAHNDQPSSPEQQLSRFLKIVSRLKWKIPFLEAGYAMAIDRVGKPQQEIDANEIHFKLDFHEFYMLIERALVHLMGVYDIVIYAQSDPNGNGYGVGSTTQSHSDGFRDRTQPHRYHENVLMALDDPANPLHQTLGQPGIRQQLARAKELRNRWKHADEADTGRFMPAPLEAYNLEEILQTVLLALEQAYFVTEAFVRQRNPSSDQNQPVSTADWTTDSHDWEFIVDASK
ncbi:hypothetical protein RRF57_006676 [Xylaria bambusicola]|uniref:Uncharacterized protein n=1 Tax=Xylaria bambusicola TaxID=326684 RepID=A0AAN7UQN5_9PEZI